MAWLTGWNYRVKLTIDQTKIDADLSNWTLAFDQSFNSVLTSVNGPLDADGARPMLSGGGDLRMTLSDGNTRIPLDVRTATINNNPALGVLELATRVTAVSSSVDTDVYLYWGKTGATQPAVGDTFGQYNAYDANLTVWSGRSTAVRTSTARTLTVVGNASVNNMDGARPYFNFDGADDGLHVTAWRTAAPLVFHGLGYVPTSGGGTAIWNGDSNLGSWSAFYGSLDATGIVGAGIAQPTNDFGSASSSPNTFSLNSWFYFAARYVTTTSRFAYVNDGVGTEITTSKTPTGVDLFHLGGDRTLADGSINNDFNGRLSELRVSAVDRAAAWLQAEYNNLLNVSGFLTWGAIETALQAEAGSYALIGTVASLEFSRVLSADAGSYAITGTDASLGFGAVLLADAGTYALSGTDASLEFGRILSAEAGVYSLTGTAADLLADRVLIAEAGSYALTGSNATLIHSAAGTFLISAESGVYSISGTAADLLFDRIISAESGSYALTGTDADLLFGFSLSAGVGAYTVSGTDANLLADRVLSAEAGSYALSGTDATLLFGFALAADVGAYSLTGTDATFSRTFVLSVGSGAYTVTGTSVTLAFSAATAGLSTYYAIMQKVQIDIQELSLVDIDSANIQLAKVQSERETIFPGLPGILVLPLGQETMPATAGTNERDDIGYPVAIVMFDIDRQDTGTGLPADALPGTQDQEFRFDRKLQWRERIRKKFINQRLDISSYVSGASIHNCLVEPGTVVDADDWLKDNIWTSVLVCRFLSRETRG